MDDDLPVAANTNDDGRFRNRVWSCGCIEEGLRQGWLQQKTLRCVR